MLSLKIPLIPVIRHVKLHLVMRKNPPQSLVFTILKGATQAAGEKSSVAIPVVKPGECCNHAMNVVR